MYEIMMNWWLIFFILVNWITPLTYESEEIFFKEYNEAQKLYKLTKCQDFECFRSHIYSDLAFYINGMSHDDWNTMDADDTIILYQIIDGQVFRRKNCLYSARCLAIDIILSKIAHKLTDTEFYVNFREISDQFYGPRVPLFSYCRRAQHYDVLIPSWSFIGAGPAIPHFHDTGIGNWKKLSDIIYKAGKMIKWNNKTKQAFFRGSRKINLRDVAISLSHQNPTLINAYYVKNQAWKSNESSGGYDPVDYVSHEEHCKYKYLLDLPTFGCSTRSRHIFLCNSLIFRNNANYTEYWSKLLKPWVHYIPIKDDLSDISEKLEFAIKNDEIARKIAEEGSRFVTEILSPDHILQYWILLLNEYSKTLSWKVVRSPKVNSLPFNNPYSSIEL